MSGQSSKDLIERGSREPTPVGSTVFVGLRSLEPIFQYAVLRNAVGSGLVQTLGTSPIAMGPSSNTGISLIDDLGLSPYRLVLLSMAATASLKQSYWEVALAMEPMPVSAATAVSVFNWALNSVNTLLFISAATSPAYGRGEGPNWPGWPSVELVVGASLFATGIATELGSEIQRSLFKKDPKNKGMVFTTGLFGLSRHVNYFGYTLWRSGFALAGGGWVWAAVTASFFAWDFNNRAIPVLDEYCSTRYGDMWKDYKKKTPYQFVPFLY